MNIISQLFFATLLLQQTKSVFRTFFLGLQSCKPSKRSYLLFGLAITFVFPIGAANALSYSAAIHYSNGSFELNEALLVQAAPAKPSSTGEYSAKLVSFRNKPLFETRFNLNLEKIYGLPISEETAQLPSEKTNETTIELSLPYYSNAKTLQITKGGEVLLQAGLEKFAACNENNACGNLESFESCPTDCACGDKKCAETENPLSCPTDCPAPTPKQTAGQGQEGGQAIPDYVQYAFLAIIALAALAVAARTIEQKTSTGNKKR